MVFNNKFMSKKNGEVEYIEINKKRDTWGNISKDCFDYL